MTLIVGIRCSDGVVIGSDSAMTFGVGRAHTIVQPFRQKIEIINDRVILAGTGSIGLSQRFADTIRESWSSNALENLAAVDVGRRLARAAIIDLQQTGATPGAYGALVALPCAAGAELIEFASDDFQPEVKADDNWYVSIGAGQPVADPLLGLFRKVFWGDQPPDIRDGVLAATMVLKLACEMAPAGVSAPIHLATLQRDSTDGYRARRLSREELSEHENNVDDAIRYFGAYRHTIAGSERSTPLPPR